MRISLLVALVGAAPLALVGGGCGGSSAGSGFGGDDSDDGGSDGATRTTGDGGVSDALFGTDTNLGDSSSTMSNQPAVVYGHSPDTLYKVDPTSKAVTVVGTFQGCSSVIDLALDKDSNMVVTTSDGFYRVDPTTAACTLIAQQGSYPNSLSFVPKGTVDQNAEALVGYVGSTYVRIDTTSGAISNIGDLNGNGLSSSGDIVSVIGGGTYLTVNGNSCSDCIVSVNPATGAMIQNYGSVNHGSVFGLAFWAGVAYGFDDGGDLFTITFGATSVTTADIPVPNAPSGLEFWGAGSTTSAPPAPQ
jgi:hypothetical protein